MGYGVSAALLAAMLLAAPTVPAGELEPARDALRRHDYARAAALLAPLADGGDAEAAYQLALLYLPRSTDVGLPPDASRACRLLGQAATSSSRAAYALAAQVESGTCKDTGRTAGEWSALAAAGGHEAPRAAPPTSVPAAEDPATLLKRAARAGDLAALNRLLAAVPATLTGTDRRPALHEAADGQQAAAARLLIAKGASVDAVDAAGETALAIAARRGAADVIGVLLDAKANPNLTDARGDTPLMLAVSAAAPAAVDALLAHGADVAPRNGAGLSALDFAERAGKSASATRIAEALRARGASSVARASVARATRADDLFSGWSPLMIAAERGDGTALRAALAAGAEVNATDPQGLTALMLAARSGHAPEVESLIGAGARLDLRAASGDTALGAAIRRRQDAIVRLLLAQHADANATLAEGAAPLSLAAAGGSADAVKALLAAGAKPNAADATGRTALMIAAEKDEAATVAALLSGGADAHATSAAGRTALALAVQAGAARATGALIGAGELETADRDGMTPLAIAAQRGDGEILGRLLRAHAALEARTRTGNTPLLLAAAAGRTDAVRQLVSAGAKLEARNELGNTALLAAVAGRQADTARVLVELGADQRIRNSASQSVADLARQAGDPALASLFGSR